MDAPPNSASYIVTSEQKLNKAYNITASIFRGKPLECLRCIEVAYTLQMETNNTSSVLLPQLRGLMIRSRRDIEANKDITPIRETSRLVLLLPKEIIYTYMSCGQDITVFELIA